MIKNLINKIKDEIERRVYLNELYEDVRNIDEVLLQKRLEIFEEILNPKFCDIGLKKWNGKYLWFNEFNNEGIKNVIGYNVLKGFGGGFTFGNCFYDVPTLSGKKLINHRTEKSTIITYYKRSYEWQKSLDNKSYLNSDRINTFNEKKFRKSILKFLDKNLSKIELWFNQNNSIDNNINSLKFEIENPPFEIGRRLISYEYILAFLYKEIGEIQKSKKYIKEHFQKSNHIESEKELILKKLNT